MVTATQSERAYNPDNGYPVWTVRELGDLSKEYNRKRCGIPYVSGYINVYTNRTFFDDDYFENRLVSIHLLFLFHITKYTDCCCIDLTSGDFVRIKSFEYDDVNTFRFEILHRKEILKLAEENEPRVVSLLQEYTPENRMAYKDLAFIRRTLNPRFLEYWEGDSVHLVMFWWTRNSRARRDNFYWGRIDAEVYRQICQEHPVMEHRALMRNTFYKKTKDSIAYCVKDTPDRLLKLLEKPEATEEETRCAFSTYTLTGKQNLYYPNCTEKWASEVLALTREFLEEKREWKEGKWRYPWRWFLGKKRSRQFEAWLINLKKKRELQQRGL